MSAGKDIVAASKSPFVDDETLAKWIDYAISQAETTAKVDEQIRIEKMIAKMSNDELIDAKSTCKFLHQERPSK